MTWLDVMEKAHIHLGRCELLTLHLLGHGKGPSMHALPHSASHWLPRSLVLAWLEALGSWPGPGQWLLMFCSSLAWKWPWEGVAGARLTGAAVLGLGGRSSAGTLLAPSVLQAAGGAVLEVPAPALRSHYDPLLVAAPPGAISCRKDPQGTRPRS